MLRQRVCTVSFNAPGQFLVIDWTTSLLPASCEHPFHLILFLYPLSATLFTNRKAIYLTPEQLYT